MSERSDGVVVFAGGGTGGHLYPGLAIAEELRARSQLRGDGGVKCVFLCSDRTLDAEILTKAKETYVASPAKPLIMRPRGLWRFMKTWGRSVREARGVIRQARKDAAVGRVVMVAMGGFVAAPAAQAARVEKVPIVLVNLDAVPGKANRFVAWRARRQNLQGGGGEVVSTIPVKEGEAGEWPVIGPIVRTSAMGSGDAAMCRGKLGLDPSLPVLMVTGGSQGAKSINSLMVELAKREAEAFKGWQVLHQCGKGEEEAVRNGYLAAGMASDRVVVREFSDRMGEWWGAAELAVSRSGAGSVAEAWANRTPCVFLPYPYHKDEHQRWNAEPLASAGGAVIEKDRIEAGANVDGAGRAIAALMKDGARRAAMRGALAELGSAGGAREVAKRVMALLSAQSARG